MSETVQDAATERTRRIPCPHCREPLDPAARVCGHCRRDTTLDVLLTDPVTDPRQRYHLSRALVALSPKPGLGDWVHRLATGGVMLKGVTAARAESVVGVLGAAGAVATARARQQDPGRKMTWVLLAGVGVLGVAAAVVFGALGMRRAAVPAPIRVSASVPAMVRAADRPDVKPALTSREVAARVLPSVAVLRCDTKTGSGFFVTEHQLVTNEHVTCGPNGVLALELADGSKGEAHLVTADEQLDLALVETTLTGPPLEVASAGDLAAGDTVMVAGAPMGLERTFHVGTVSNARRVLLDVCYLQIDARINHGNSGGPVLDAEGRAVAVVSMKQDQAEGIGFAVPIDYAFEGQRPLMPAPKWHPTNGFSTMLADVERENERLLEESKRLPMRVVKAIWLGKTQIVAGVATMSELEPIGILSFRLDQQDHAVCSVSASARWQESPPGRGLAKRTREWMEKMGMGKVYAGAAVLDVESCQFEKDIPIQVILREGDETLNRVLLQFPGR